MAKNTNKNETPQNKRLDNQRKKVLKKLLSDRYSIGKNKKLIDFLSLYIDCEATAKKYVYYYKHDKKQKKSDAFDSLKYNEVEKAAWYFGLKPTEDLIVKIFESSTGKRNQKTPRQLRNGIFHSKSSEDIEEVESRFDELKEIMQRWIDITNESTNRL